MSVVLPGTLVAEGLAPGVFKSISALQIAAGRVVTRLWFGLRPLDQRDQALFRRRILGVVHPVELESALELRDFRLGRGDSRLVRYRRAR